MRGQIRVKPPELNMDWTVRVEISNLNRDSTAGQAVGTGAGLAGQGDPLNYRDQDLIDRENFLISDFRAKNPTLPQAEVKRLAALRLAKELYKQSGDRHPYTGDLDSPGRTLLETHSVSTTGVIDLDFAETTVNFGFIDYRKSESRDTDLTPNIKFPSRSNDQAWEYYGDVAMKGNAERGRIGMDLHDGIIQAIYGAGLSLEGALHTIEESPAEAKERIRHSIDGLNQAIRDLRAYTLDLRPRQMGNDGLMSGLRRLATEFRTNSLAEVGLTGPDSELIDLSPSQALALFHICQETLANAAKHAKASKVEIS